MQMGGQVTKYKYVGSLGVSGNTVFRICMKQGVAQDWNVCTHDAHRVRTQLCKSTFFAHLRPLYEQGGTGSTKINNRSLYDRSRI